MPKPRRAVITGLGVIAPNGIGKDAFWQSLIAGESAVDVIRTFDASAYPCKVAAEVRNFDPTEYMHVRRTKHRGRFSQFAVAAAKLAVYDSKLNLSAENSERVMACVGTTLNGLADVYEAGRRAWESNGFRDVSPTVAIEVAAHAPVSHVSVELGIRGQAMTLSSACSSGLDVIEWACARIQDNSADIVIAGSTDAPISESLLAGFCALGALSTSNDPPTRSSRPYDLRRTGLVLGEGSCICVVEEREHALERGAPLYAEVLGFGAGNEGGFATRTDSAEIALRLAIASALRRAGTLPHSIDYICAHGNGMPDFDLVETRAFKDALGHVAYNIPVSSIKSMIGHAMGAAATFQVAAACLALNCSVIPPTINLETPDPECDLDYVPNHARVGRVRNALVNAHAMGGTHSVLLLGSPDSRAG